MIMILIMIIIINDDYEMNVNFILSSSIDVGGGDHFGGADPDATPLDDGEVTIVTNVTIINWSWRGHLLQ